MSISLRARTVWQTGQAVALVALSGAIVGLVTWPEMTLRLFWNVIVPLVPASLLVTPDLWRNLCPLATAHMALNRTGTTKLATGALPWTGAGAVALLFLLVPARHFVFNTNGLALAAVILAVLAAALALGAFVDAKGGFCNAVCPVLPVERLYGHDPLFRVGNPRCLPCSLCTQRGCIDLGPNRAALTALANRDKAEADALTFARTPFGVFAAAFPGFIIGYFTASDVPLAQAGATYLHVGIWTLGSTVVALAAVQLLPITRRQAVKAIAAAAVSLYYWYAATGISEAFALGIPGTWGIRVAAALLILAWLPSRQS